MRILIKIDYLCKKINDMGAPKKPKETKLTRVSVSLTELQLERLGVEKVREICSWVINKEYKKL